MNSDYINDDPLNVLLYTIPSLSHREPEHEHLCNLLRVFLVESKRIFAKLVQLWNFTQFVMDPVNEQ